MPGHLPAEEPQPGNTLRAAGDDALAAAARLAPLHGPAMHSPRLLVGATVFSGSLHAAAAAAILVGWSALPETGVLKTPTDAASLEKEFTIVLEAVVSTPAETQAAASSAMPLGAVEPNEVAPQPLTPVTPKPVEASPPSRAVTTAEVIPQAAEGAEEPLPVIEGAAEPDAATQAQPQPEETKEVRPEAEREPSRKPEREKTRRESARPQTAGGAASRAHAAGAKTSGRVSASSGSVISYAAHVRAKVARNKPPGNGHRGVAQVSFGVSPSGGLSYARLARSSGSSALDSAALSAVRRAAPFGPPPPGTSSAQLRFSIPFYFR